MVEEADESMRDVSMDCCDDPPTQRGGSINTVRNRRDSSYAIQCLLTQ